MPDHRFSFSVSPDSRPWWRTWIHYPNPTLDALLGMMFGIAVIVIAFWLLTAM